MRTINIANEKKRDAEVSLEVTAQKKQVRQVLADGRDRNNVKIIKSSLGLSEEMLSKNYEDLKAFGEAIIATDPEVDMEVIGRKVNSTHKLYLNKDNKIAYRVNLMQVRYNPDGSEIDRKDADKVPANINGEIPVQWTGKKFSKAEIIHKFVFSKKYQIKHISGLTYDFLYDMAKQLHDSQSLMFMGAGKKANEPLTITTGGENYRGFLEGRVNGDKYCLILHLTNMEMKGL